MATYDWNGSTDSDLNKAANWSLNKVSGVNVPGTNDIAQFGSANGSPVHGTLNVSQFLVNSGPLAFDSGSITAASETIGGGGDFSLDGTLNNVTTNLTLEGGGKYSAINGGVLSVGGDEIVGANGPGNFSLNASTNTITGNLTLGQTSGSGVYNISGANASLSVGKNFILGDESGSSVGQEDGTAAVTGQLILGNQSGSDGKYDLKGGTLTVGHDEIVGNSGGGEFDQSAGNHTITGNLILGLNNGNNSKYVFHGGTLQAAGLTIGKGGSAVFDMNTSETLSIATAINLGVDVGSDGEFEVRQASSFTASGTGTNSAITVGVSGDGLLDIEDISLVTANFVQFGFNAGAAGEGSIKDGSKLSVATNVVFGQSGQAAVAVFNGGMVEADRVLLGNMAGSKGALAIFGTDAVVQSDNTSTTVPGIAIGVAGTGAVLVGLSVDDKSQVTVSGGGLLHSASSIAVGGSASSTGGLVIAGSGAEVSATTTIFDGIAATGGIAGGAGGLLTAASLTIGTKGGLEAGSATLSGPLQNSFQGDFTVKAASVTDAGKILVDANSTLHFVTDVFTLAKTGTASIAAGGILEFDKSVTINNLGSFFNAGEIALLAGTTATFQGGGKIVQGDGPGADSPIGGATLNNVDNTFSGGGSILVDLINQAKGTINGNATNNALRIHNTGTTNHGLIEGTSAKGLILQSNVGSNDGTLAAIGAKAALEIDAAVTNTAKGVILASGAGAHVDLKGASVTGGTFKTLSGGVIQTTDDSTITDVANTGSLKVGNGTTLDVASNLTTGVNGSGVFNNSGTVTVDGNGGSATLAFASDITLQGGGSVVLASLDHTAAIHTGNSVTIYNGTATSAHTISGNGDLGSDTTILVNGAKGVINGNGPGSTHIPLNIVASEITNNGIMEGTNPLDPVTHQPVDSLGLEFNSGAALIHVVNNNLIEALGAGAIVDFETDTHVDNGPKGVILASGAGAEVHIDGGVVTISGGTLQTAGGGQFVVDNTLTLDATGNAGNPATQVNIAANMVDDAEQIILRGNNTDAIFNTKGGTIQIQSESGGFDGQLLVDGGATLQGGGKIVLVDDANGASNEIGRFGATSDTLINADNIISGAGTIDIPNLTNGLKGVINGNGTDNPLIIDTLNANNTINHGIIEGTTSEGLIIQCDFDTNDGTFAALSAAKSGTDNARLDINGNVTNAGKGLIEALGTGAHVLLEHNTITNTATSIILASGVSAHVDLDDETIVGGTLKTTGGSGATLAVIQTAGTGTSTLDGTGSGNPVNNAGFFLINDDTVVELEGALNNTGTLQINTASGVNSSTAAWLIGDVTLTGAGKVMLANDNASILTDGFAHTLTNGDSKAGNTISGLGTIGDGNLHFVNNVKGIVNASDANSGVLHIATADVTNNGVLEATGHGVLELDVNVSDALVTAAVKAAASGAHVDLNGITITGGAVSTVAGSVLESIADGSKIANDAAHGNKALVNAGALEANGHSLTVTGAVASSGDIFAHGGVLDIQGAVTGTGTAHIDNGGTLDFALGATFKTVTFGSGNDTLTLESSTTAANKFAGTIVGFVNGDHIELGAIGFTNGDVNITNQASFANHVLTVHDNSGHSIALTFDASITDVNQFQIQNHSGHVDLLHV
ncbi:MAG TPA: hypothetical protein VFB31_02905 [Pseudolabrys sp.]|nr:hypothetical protein [Pseudolabrys sp.]